MNTQDSVEIRALADSELDEVSGGFWNIVFRLAQGIGMALLENQQHNGRGTGTLRGLND
jgi:hypothetical protein